MGEGGHEGGCYHRRRVRVSRGPVPFGYGVAVGVRAGVVPPAVSVNGEEEQEEALPNV